MLVIVIIGILAAVAIPRFTGAIRMAKEAEAENILGSLRSAQLRYHAQWDGWASSSEGIGALDVDIVGGKYYSPALPDSPVSDSDIAHADVKAGVTGLSSKKIAADGTISDQ